MAGKSYLGLGADVASALEAGRPVVALESTIITHGMPWPENLEMARRVEAIVKEAGAMPATVAIMDGRLRVGLGDADLERLARAGQSAAKASRRDVAALLADAETVAGTTVATTMQAAALAGIRVFATGGIGGVHRGAEESFDISADLDELARTPVAVVCAGAKSILDIPRTLEVLETRGVPVIGYGTDAFPAFWARDSGEKASHRADSPEQVARILGVQFALSMGGVLIANPIPEAAAMESSEISGFIETALAEAKSSGVRGKAVTPFLLGRIVALSGGRSLAANIALVENNARVAAAIAVALARIAPVARPRHS